MSRRLVFHLRKDHTVIVAWKGGPGSGHRGHQGRPGKRGGSLPGHTTVSAYVDSLGDIKTTGNMFGTARLEYFQSLGYTAEEFDEMEGLLNSYGYGGGNQERAERLIEENLEGNTRVGKILRDQIALETAIHKKYVEQTPTRVDKLLKQELQTATEELNYSWDKGGMWYDDVWYGLDRSSPLPQSKTQALVDLTTNITNSYGSREVYLYRKGNTDRVIQSWTTNAGGAVMGGVRDEGIGWNRRMPMSEVVSSGYLVLGGWSKLMGSPGEGERTLIRADVVYKKQIVLKGGPGSGHHDHLGRPGKRGGSLPGLLLDGEFANSPVGNTLRDLAHDYDFVLFGSAAARLYIGEELGKLPNDIDVLDLTKKHAQVSSKWDDHIDRSFGAMYDVVDTKTGVVVQSLPSNTLVGLSSNGFTSELKTPALYSVSGEPNYRTIGGIKVLSPAPLMQSLYDRGDYDGVQAMIRSMNLPRDYVNERWYQFEYDEVTGNVLKGGEGSGHFGHEGRQGKRGGSLPGTGNHLPMEQRVWQGKQQPGKVPFNQNETGRRGEQIAVKAMKDMFGVEFSILNVGLNNAPIDVAGDHHAIEVKTGPATNGRSAQQWRITTSYTSGPTEKALIAKMTPKERSEYNTYKQQQSMERKVSAVAEMSKIAGTEIKPVTLGVIMSADGSRGDVFMVPGFHLRLGWNQYATDEYYIGTWGMDD